MKRRRFIPVLSAVLTIAGLTASYSTANASDNATVSYTAQGIQDSIVHNPDDYAGVYCTRDTNTLHVTVTREALSKISALYSRVRSVKFQDAASPAQPAAAVKIEPVRYSRSDLARVMAFVRSAEPWATVTRDTLATWGIDSAADKVQIGVTKITAETRDAAAKAFGDKVELVQ